ncbi:MAG TPA: nucleoside-diphosphate sugar epimerase/dehydratase [Bacteroidales bacterium]|nr:nucleoside-diphosphate sugar epimerase/dehydratase [Bacteroidales bacterium]HRX97242.1 nucleoside-diphosphate sugar epimerase/dehydratase [Bacteroidales bacterium]
MLFSNHNMPRWLIFLIDMAIVLFSVIVAYLLRFNFHVPEVEMRQWPLVFTTVLTVRALSFIISKTYAGIIRYTSTEDAIRIFLVILAGSVLFGILNLLSFYFINEKYVVPFSIIIIEFITVIFAMVTFRIVVKIAYLEITNPSGSRTRVLIFGAGEAGLIAKRALDRDAGSRYKVVAFVDDDRSKWGKKIEGTTIQPFDKLESLIEEHKVENVIIAVQKLRPGKKQEIVDICLKHNARVLTVPPVSTWINGELSFNQIRKVKIEDLLERDEIQISYEKISQDLRDKVVLVTGASGSIGSELVRQIARFDPQRIILIDQAESAMFDLEIELLDRFKGQNFEIAIADIRNASRMENAFRTFKPEIVFHAAAYKHVPMMENNPSEAIQTNVRGTRILADLAVKYGVEKFIMISTDKAVNPTNVMGASKRIAEIYTQSLNQEGKTKFITTRFGNVLGSNGSAVNLFRTQIEGGGPVTVTHPEIIRYFMTIPEACRLVLEAATMGKGGEIYLFDMGKPVKILDLAERMIRLSGLEVGRDIEVRFTGLRPGEKLFEELLNDGENVIGTDHAHIMIGKVRTYDLADITQKISALEQMFDEQDNFAIVKKMKEIVPEFISQNSVYEKLDKHEGSSKV